MTGFVRRLGPAVGPILLLSLGFGGTGHTVQQANLPAGGVPVVAPDALLTTPVGGLERTNGEAKSISVKGQPFSAALHVTIRKSAVETNATQLTIPNSRAVTKGDVLLASFWMRGGADVKHRPAQVIFLFERMVEPWTKSITESEVSLADSKGWRHIFVPFKSAEDYSPHEAMVSLRFALQPQNVEIGGLSVLDFGANRSLDDLVEFTAAQNPIGQVSAHVDFSESRQTLLGFGGDFCQPRYGSSEPMDVVGRYALNHLNVVHARIGFPLNNWTPNPGEFRDEEQAHAALLAIQEMSRRHIPTVLTVWEGPRWMLGGQPEQAGRVLPPSKYDACIEAIVRFLVLARDKYGSSVDYFSFNEPDYGVNFGFNPKTMGDFIRVAGPKFKAAHLKTRFIVGDTTGGSPFRNFALPLLEDPSIAPYLGPLGFHCWDGLTASDESYRSIAQLGKTYHKPVWCLEAGWDSGLWQTPNPWGTWNNGLLTAQVYARTLNLSGASLMDYWTYQDNYPIVDKSGPKPYPVFLVIKQMESVCVPGSHVVFSQVDESDLQVLVTAGPTQGRFSGLIVNTKGPGTLSLRGLPPKSQILLTVSDKTVQRHNLGKYRVSGSGTVFIHLPARSVVTFIRA